MSELAEGGFDVSQGAMEVLQEHYISGCASEDETSQTIEQAGMAAEYRMDG